MKWSISNESLDSNLFIVEFGGGCWRVVLCCLQKMGPKENVNADLMALPGVQFGLIVKFHKNLFIYLACLDVILNYFLKIINFTFKVGLFVFIYLIKA